MLVVDFTYSTNDYYLYMISALIG